MKQLAYTAPQSRAIKFELCDSLMFLPQSQQGGDQLSGRKEYADESGWSSSGWDTTEDDYSHSDQ